MSARVRAVVMAKNKLKVEAFMNSHARACDVCGAAGTLAVGSTHRKSLKLSMRCMAHRHGLRQVFTIGLDVSLAVSDSIAKMARACGVPSDQKFKVSGGTSAFARDDAAWFKAHASRTHRVRDAFKGEWPSMSPEMKGAVIVRQIEPGQRVRRWLITDGDIPYDDNVLAVLFDTKPGIVVCVQAAIARAKLMKMVGGTA